MVGEKLCGRKEMTWVIFMVYGNIAMRSIQTFPTEEACREQLSWVSAVYCIRTDTLPSLDEEKK